MTPADLIVDHLDDAKQIALIDAVVESLSVAPFFQPTLPRWGTPFSVRMTNLGVLGWVSDKRGYRYQALHPDTGTPWAPMPQMLLALWQKHAGYAHPPEACLVNHYGPKAKMGLHQDRDEADFDAPVLSVSLGDSARFRLGGTRREDPTTSFMLESGDVMMLAGPERLAFHGIDRLMPGTSTLLRRHDGVFPEGGRINLTLRRVTLP